MQSRLSMVIFMYVTRVINKAFVEEKKEKGLSKWCTQKLQFSCPHLELFLFVGRECH